VRTASGSDSASGGRRGPCDGAVLRLIRPAKLSSLGLDLIRYEVDPRTLGCHNRTPNARRERNRSVPILAGDPCQWRCDVVVAASTPKVILDNVEP